MTLKRTAFLLVPHYDGSQLFKDRTS